MGGLGGGGRRRFWVQHILWNLKMLFCFRIETFFSNGHIHNVVSTLSNVVQVNVEKHNVVNFNVDIHNVVTMLLWRCATSRRHIKLKTTLNRCWNACMVDIVRCQDETWKSQKYNSIDNLQPANSNVKLLQNHDIFLTSRNLTCTRIKSPPQSRNNSTRQRKLQKPSTTQV